MQHNTTNVNNRMLLSKSVAETFVYSNESHKLLLYIKQMYRILIRTNYNLII